MNVSGNNRRRIQTAGLRLQARWTLSFRKKTQSRGDITGDRRGGEFQAEPAAGRTVGRFPGFTPTTGEAARFTLFKQRLLLQRLDEIPRSELHADIICAAEEAAALAWQTPFPFLVFYELFEERVRAACLRDQHQATTYWQALRSPPYHASPPSSAMSC